MATRRAFLMMLGAGMSAMATPRGSAAWPRRTGATLQAGAGRATVTFDGGLFPLDGFIGQHDALQTRVLLLEFEAKRYALVSIDLTSISQAMIASLKAVLNDLAGVTPENAMICASHSFSTPHVFSAGDAPPGTDATRNAGAARAYQLAMHDAVTQAVHRMRAARIGFDLGVTRVNVNRDVETPFGWWLGSDDAGFADPALGVVRLDDLDGKPLAVLMDVPVQASVMDGSQSSAGGKLISADLAGATARRVEHSLGGDAVALFIAGAAGDQAPILQADRPVADKNGKGSRIDLHEAGFVLLDLLAEKLSADVLRIVQGIQSRTVTTVTLLRKQFTVTSQKFSPQQHATGPVKSFRYEVGAEVDVPVAIWRVGDMAWIGLQVELAASVGAFIRAHSPFACTMVATMVDGAAKYMPDARSYDRFTYEARSSFYAKGAAETVATAILETLKHIH